MCQQQMQPTQTAGTNSVTLSPGDQWTQRFRKRHKFSLGTKPISRNNMTAIISHFIKTLCSLQINFAQAMVSRSRGLVVRVQHAQRKRGEKQTGERSRIRVTLSFQNKWTIYRQPLTGTRRILVLLEGSCATEKRYRCTHRIF